MTQFFIVVLELLFSAAPPPRVAYRYDWVVKVADREAAADTVIARVESAGGYFIERSDDALHLKVPVEEVKAVLADVAPLGTVVSRASQARDLGQMLDEQRTLLQSREQMLARYFVVLNEASVSSVVTVEQQMTELVQSIETLRGALRLAEHELPYADVTLSFHFRDRRAPVSDGRSSFGWLNKVNLADLLGEYARD